MIGNELLYTTVATEVKIGATDTTSSGGGENLLETPEETADTTASDGATEEETTDTDTDNADVSNVDSSVNEGEVIDASGDTGDMAIDGDMSFEGDMSGVDGMNGETTGSTIKDPFLSSYVPIAGISAATLVVGVIIGILLAKKKIKKGIDLYED